MAVVVPSDAFAVGDADDAVQQMARHVRFWCRHHHMRPCEIPAAVLLEPRRWTPAGGLVTENLKKSRRKLLQHYAQDAERLFAAVVASGAEAEEAGVSCDGLGEELRELLGRAIALPAGVAASDTVGDLGADSLVAGRLVELLRTKGVEVSLQSLFRFELSHLAALLAAAGSGMLLEAVEERVRWAEEWGVARCRVAEAELAPWARAAVRGPAAGAEPEPRVPSPPPCEAGAEAEPSVLLTGATGFLGPARPEQNPRPALCGAHS